MFSLKCVVKAAAAPAATAPLMNERRSIPVWLAATPGFASSGIFLPNLIALILCVASGLSRPIQRKALTGAAYERILTPIHTGRETMATTLPSAVAPYSAYLKRD